MRLLRFDFPVHLPREAFLAGGEPVIPPTQPTHLLLARADYARKLVVLKPVASAILHQLAENVDLATALETSALESGQEPEQALSELGIWFQEWTSFWCLSRAQGIFEFLPIAELISP